MRRFCARELAALDLELAMLEAAILKPRSNGQDREVVSVILDADDFEVAPIIYLTMFVKEVEKLCWDLGDLLGGQRGNGRMIHAGQTQLERGSWLFHPWGCTEEEWSRCV